MLCLERKTKVKEARGAMYPLLVIQQKLKSDTISEEELGYQVNNVFGRYILCCNLTTDGRVRPNGYLLIKASTSVPSFTNV